MKMLTVYKTFLLLAVSLLVEVNGEIARVEGLNCPISPLTIPPGFSFVHLPNGKGPLGLIGDVNDVLQGRVTKQTESTLWRRQSTGSIGFGAGAIGPLGGLGEAVYLNGQAVIRSTDNGTSDYFKTITGSEFRSPFSLFIMEGTTADGEAKYSSMGTNHVFTLMDLYGEIYEAFGKFPFCFNGLVTFSSLEGIAISKAPVYGEPLFGESASNYYTQPMFRLSNEYGMIFGCAANFSATQNKPELLNKLSKLLYVNPLDIGALKDLQVHSHFITLKQCVKDLKVTNASVVAKDVFHLLSSSIISHAHAQVFLLNESEKLVEITFNSTNSRFTSNEAKGNNYNNILSSFVLVTFLNMLVFLFLTI